MGNVTFQMAKFNCVLFNLLAEIQFVCFKSSILPNTMSGIFKEMREKILHRYFLTAIGRSFSLVKFANSAT
jgi:hypothetical protein